MSADLIESLDQVVAEMRAARARCAKLEKDLGDANNDKLFAQGQQVALEANVRRLSHRPDVWPSGVADAFWRAFREAEQHHGYSESTYAGINAAMQAAGYWRPVSERK